MCSRSAHYQPPAYSASSLDHAHAPIRLAPLVVRRLRYAQIATHICYQFLLTRQHFILTQLASNFLQCTFALLYLSLQSLLMRIAHPKHGMSSRADYRVQVNRRLGILDTNVVACDAVWVCCEILARDSDSLADAHNDVSDGGAKAPAQPTVDEEKILCSCSATCYNQSYDGVRSLGGCIVS